MLVHQGPFTYVKNQNEVGKDLQNDLNSKKDTGPVC